MTSTQSPNNFGDIPGRTIGPGTTLNRGMFAYIPVYQKSTDAQPIVTVTWKRGTFQVLVLATATTTVRFSDPVEGMTCSLLLVQDATGSRLVEWQANYAEHYLDPAVYPTIKWMAGGGAPELSTDANAGDMISLKWLQVPLKAYWGMYTLGMM